MNRPYKEFKEKWEWRKVDYDKKYWYQCVDLAKQYMDECLKMGKIWAIWNAKQIPNNLKWKFVVLDTNNIRQWDIIVRTKGTYGHVAIVDHVYNWKVYVLEQNWTWKNSWSWTNWNEIRIQPYDMSFYNVILRNSEITNNYNKEIWFVDDKIKERQQLLNDTIEYKSTLEYRK